MQLLFLTKQGDPDAEKRVGNWPEVRGMQGNLLKRPNITIIIQNEHTQL